MPQQSATPIAKWNKERDCWEAGSIDLLSGLSDVYSETFPISGSMRNGVVYEHQMSAHRMDGSGSLSSQQGGKLLPTATAQDSAGSGGSSEANVTLTDAVVRTAMGTRDNPRLLPTPRSNEANGVGVHGTGGQDLRTTVELLPTPKAGDADFGMPRTSGRPPERSTHLMTRLAHTSPNAMLPTPRATRGGSNTEIAYGFGGERADVHRKQGTIEIPEGSGWGPYAAAIARWEAVLGRPAPDPTEAGPKGGRRLSAAFVEWMMGLPEGWVTGHGLPRTAELKMLGNGVVTRQALRALRLAEVAG